MKVNWTKVADRIYDEAEVHWDDSIPQDDLPHKSIEQNWLFWLFNNEAAYTSANN